MPTELSDSSLQGCHHMYDPCSSGRVDLGHSPCSACALFLAYRSGHRWCWYLIWGNHLHGTPALCGALSLHCPPQTLQDSYLWALHISDYPEPQHQGGQAATMAVCTLITNTQRVHLLPSAGFVILQGGFAHCSSSMPTDTAGQCLLLYLIDVSHLMLFSVILDHG